MIQILGRGLYISDKSYRWRIIHATQLILPTGHHRTLPDEVLLEVLDFYVVDLQVRNKGADGWHTLVHVSRRWRNVVFASPRRLDLPLLCTYRRLVKGMQNIWPE